MYQLSETLRAALEARTPQRVMLRFADKVFSNEGIMVSAGVELDEIFCSGADPEIGECPSAEIRFDMLNDEGQLEDFEFGEFTAWLGARIDSGTPPQGAMTETFEEGGVDRLYEFMPLGTFIADRPYIVRKKILSISANDQMVKFDQNMPSFLSLGLSATPTLAQLYAAMCTFAGVQYETTTDGGQTVPDILNRGFVIKSEPEEFQNATMREVLGWIAEIAGGIARFNREGKLEIVWFGTAGNDDGYNESNYTEFTPAWFETEAIDSLRVRNSANDAEETFHDSSSQDANSYLIQGNPLIQFDDET